MTDATGFFVWYELMTADVAAAKRFYGNVLGWTAEDVPMPGMTYTEVKAGEARVAGLMTLPKEAADPRKPCWTGYIAVPDVDAAAPKVVSLGGKIVSEPMDIPKVGRFAVLAAGDRPAGRAVCRRWRTRQNGLTTVAAALRRRAATQKRKPMVTGTNDILLSRRRS